MRRLAVGWHRVGAKPMFGAHIHDRSCGECVSCVYRVVGSDWEAPTCLEKGGQLICTFDEPCHLFRHRWGEASPAVLSVSGAGPNP
jgi:hypothetical protein